MRVTVAEEVGHYWKTSKSSAERWLEKTAALILKHGGEVQGYGSGMDIVNNAGAFVLMFRLDGRQYKINWPILPSKAGTEVMACKRQAATMMYHNVKAQLIASKVLGPEIAFAQWMVLSDMSTLAEQVAANFEPVSLLTDGGVAGFIRGES